MEKRMKALVSIIGLVFLVFAFYFITKAITVYTGYSIKDNFNEEEKEELAKCLNERNASMFGAYRCPHCTNQKKLFGKAFSYINYIECTEKEEECKKAGIEDYPTWIINNQMYFGEKSLKELADLSGCNMQKKEIKIERMG